MTNKTLIFYRQTNSQKNYPLFLKFNLEISFREYLLLESVFINWIVFPIKIIRIMSFFFNIFFFRSQCLSFRTHQKMLPIVISHSAKAQNKLFGGSNIRIQEKFFFSKTFLYLQEKDIQLTEIFYSVTIFFLVNTLFRLTKFRNCNQQFTISLIYIYLHFIKNNILLVFIFGFPYFSNKRNNHQQNPLICSRFILN